LFVILINSNHERTEIIIKTNNETYKLIKIDTYISINNTIDVLVLFFSSKFTKLFQSFF